mmetsp:Transcript_2686/g.5046  ORF Transcript_2686/g.5046 Transcript_2686/m.5046 type:complete len:100 (+) Transcript_2686:860-1159(+)
MPRLRLAVNTPTFRVQSIVHGDCYWAYNYACRPSFNPWVGKLHADTRHVSALHYKKKGGRKGADDSPTAMEADHSAMFRWKDGRLAPGVRQVTPDQKEP